MPTRPTILSPPCRTGKTRPCGEEELVPRVWVRGYCKKFAKRLWTRPQRDGFRHFIFERVPRAPEQTVSFLIDDDYDDEDDAFQVLTEREALADVIDLPAESVTSTTATGGYETDGGPSEGDAGSSDDDDELASFLESVESCMSSTIRLVESVLQEERRRA